MAIFSYRMGERISRGRGHSAVRVAAYQAREKYRDERTGYSYNSLPRERVGIQAASDYIGRNAGYDEGRKAALFVGLYAPSGAPDWCRGRENIEKFWSKAELAERRQDAQIAERIIIALPHELSLKQNIWLLQDHVKEFTRQGRVVQVAIHEPEHTGAGAEKNIHAHLLVSMRGVDEHGFKASKAETQHRYLHRREYVQGLRERWADATNRHLARHGHEGRIDHRTLAEQGIDRAPTIHLGPGDSRRERRGERSAAGEINREIAAKNVERGRQSLDRVHGERHQDPQPQRSAEIIDPDAWRRGLEQDAPEQAGRELEQEPLAKRAPARAEQDASQSAPKAAQQREAEREAEAPAAANAASAAPQRGRVRPQNGDRNLFGRTGSMIRSAFEATLDWIAPRVADPHQHPVPQPPPSQLQPEKPAAERPMHHYERLALRRREREQEEGRSSEQNSPLYQRYKIEREAAYQARQAAERDVYERFAAYAEDMKGFYNLRFEQEKNSGMPGPERHDAMQLLSAMRRGDRVTARRLEREQIAIVRRAHPLPDWGSWLKREAEKGDREAEKALERHQAREAERNRDRDDDGRGIEP